MQKFNYFLCSLHLISFIDKQQRAIRPLTGCMFSFRLSLFTVFAVLCCCYLQWRAVPYHLLSKSRKLFTASRAKMWSISSHIYFYASPMPPLLITMSDLWRSLLTFLKFQFVLYWLPIERRIDFKIANITFNTLHYSQPAYLHSLLYFHTSARSLTPSNTNLPTIPFTRTLLGARGFFVATVKIWTTHRLQLCAVVTVPTLTADTSELTTSIKLSIPLCASDSEFCWHCVHL